MPTAVPPPPNNDNLQRLRDRILDPDVSVIPDRMYRDAAEAALQRLSRDFSTTYTTDDSVPWDRQYLFIILATIELARYRAAQEATGVSGSSSSMTELEVPNLRIQEASEAKHGADYWASYADALEDQYLGEVGNAVSVDTIPQVEVAALTRQNLRTGGRMQYSSDYAPTAPTGVSTVVSGSDVTVKWTKVTGPYSGGYEIFRDSVSTTLETPGTSQRIFMIPDPHGWPKDGVLYTERTDLTRPSGTWYYVVATVNKNGLRSFSSIVSAAVP